MAEYNAPLEPPGEPETYYDLADDEDILYDLAGNPIASAPREAPPPPPPQYVPGPGSFTPPPVYSNSPAAPAPNWGGNVVVSKKGMDGPVLFVSLGAAAVLVVALIFGIRALKPAQVTAPKSYKSYSAIDSSFSCQQPVGWKMKETGAEQGIMSTVAFSQGHVRVKVVSDAIGSLLGDIGNGPSLGPQKPPVEKLHEYDKAQLTKDMPGYEEGEAKAFTSAVGDSRVSEWTADGGAGVSKMHGYRVTMLGNQREITVICFSPERNWKTLKPAFEYMINNVTPGNGP